MTLIKLLIHGWFADSEDPAEPRSLDIDGDHIAGFYATRVIDLADEDAGMEGAKDFLRRELSCLILSRRPDVIINFDLQDYSEVDFIDPEISSRGFTFY